MNSTRPTESTAPVSCATSTTPTVDGGTTDTEKRHAPTPAHFRRERRRHQKALHQLKMLEAANKRLWEEKEAMQQEIERLKTDVSHRQRQADLLRHRLSFISSFRTEEDRFACRITASVLINPRLLRLAAQLVRSFAPDLWSRAVSPDVLKQVADAANERGALSLVREICATLARLQGQISQADVSKAIRLYRMAVPLINTRRALPGMKQAA